MHVIVVNGTAVGDVEDTLYKCNALNGTNVGEVEDTQDVYTVHCTLNYRADAPESEKGNEMAAINNTEGG